MTIWIDVDSVVRDLILPAYGVDNIPVRYTQKTITGEDFVEFFDKRLNLLQEAPGTKYYQTILEWAKKRLRIDFLTHQKESWQPYTYNWIVKHFQGVKEINIQFTDSWGEKIEFIKDGDYLIDDHPALLELPGVYGPEYLYNQHMIKKTLKNQQEMMNFLNKIDAN
jgi:hypothetical protein